MSADQSKRIVDKLWNYCNVLRDDRLSYQDYLEQLTYLLFLEMALERGEPRRRWRAYEYEELIGRDKASLDLFWIRDEALEETANVPEPDVIAREIVEDLRAALEELEEIAAELEGLPD